MDHTFVIDVPVELRFVKTDMDKLEQIATNLLNNAVKYSPNGGRIVIVVSEVPGDPSLLRVSFSDEGLGIPPEEIPKLFQLYERTQGAGALRVTGTGLGLYLVKRLVEALGGEISVDSQVGRGSTFSFTLPRA